MAKTGTKIYYSDKSESSVEDLMDETPSNYNIPNGRLDGKSTGFRFGGSKTLNKNISDVHESARKRSSPPKQAKKFRQDIVEEPSDERQPHILHDGVSSF